MAHKVHAGWIAPFPNGKEFSFFDDTGAKEVRRRATGIYVGSSGHGAVRLNYAGADASLMYFDLPKDPELLREIAEAILGYAEDL